MSVDVADAGRRDAGRDAGRDVGGLPPRPPGLPADWGAVVGVALGHYLRGLRRQHRWSTAELVRRHNDRHGAEATVSQVSSWERADRAVSVVNLARWTATLGVSLSGVLDVVEVIAAFWLCHRTGEGERGSDRNRLCRHAAGAEAGDETPDEVLGEVEVEVYVAALTGAVDPLLTPLRTWARLWCAGHVQAPPWLRLDGQALAACARAIDVALPDLVRALRDLHNPHLPRRTATAPRTAPGENPAGDDPADTAQSTAHITPGTPNTQSTGACRVSGVPSTTCTEQ